MSASREAGLPQPKRGYNLGGMVAFQRPDEIVVPLRRDEFEVLCEGEASSEKSNRDLSAGIGMTGLVGLVGVLATADWNSSLLPGHRAWFLLFLIALSVITVGACVATFIFQTQLKKTLHNSAFSRIKARMQNWFEEPRTIDAVIESLGQPRGGTENQVRQIRWGNVANLFWLGSDLAWTLQIVRGVGLKQQILHGLKQTYHHASELGMADLSPVTDLSFLAKQAETSDAAPSSQWRSDFAEKLLGVQRKLDDIVRVEQPGFRPGP